MAAMTPDALRKAGLDALRRELGVVGTVRFLQQFETGSGDYTAERWQWLSADDDVETLVKKMEEAAADAK